MNIFILNNSGNTGKTTLRKHLFVPQMGSNVNSFEIESINTGDGDVDKKITEKEFKFLAGRLNISDEGENFVVDCGASNIEKVLAHMLGMSTTRSAIDYWVIPSVPQKKQVADSVQTVRSLLDMGIPAERIVIVLNNITDVDAIQDDFKLLFALEKLGVHLSSQGVLSNEVFEQIKGLNQSVFDIAANPLDIKAMKKAALASDDPEEAFTRLAEASVLFDMATNAKMNLEAVFKSTPIYKDMQALKAEAVAE